MKITAKPSPDLNWQPGPTELTRECILALVYGDSESGKTTFALSAPDPIAYLHSNENLQGKIQRATNAGKQVEMFSFATPDIQGITDPSVIKLLNTEVEDNFWKVFYDAFNWSRTTIIDTIDGFNLLQRMADFGAIKASGSTATFKYGPLNARFLQMMGEFKRQADTKNQTNLIFIARTKDEWIKNPEGKGYRTSGKKIYTAQDSAFFDSEIRLRTRFNPGTKLFSTTVEKAFIDAATVGTVYKGEDENFFANVMGDQTGDIEKWIE